MSGVSPTTVTVSATAASRSVRLRFVVSETSTMMSLRSRQLIRLANRPPERLTDSKKHQSLEECRFRWGARASNLRQNQKNQSHFLANRPLGANRASMGYDQMEKPPARVDSCSSWQSTAAYRTISRSSTVGAVQQLRSQERHPFYPLADMFITDAVNTADALWSKIELGTIVLAAQPDLYGAGWWQGAVTERVLTVMLPKEY